jgi:hypothetical protein
MLFIDGGMNHAHPDRYELLDLETGQAWQAIHPPAG